MQESKFRAWNKSGKQWEHFTLTELALGAMYTKVKGTNALVCHWDNYEHWSQSTGLEDKTGVEIYEGDIIQNVAHKNIWVVVWDRKHAKFGFQYVSGTMIDARATLGGDIEYEIIGNIHSNPELMEAKDGQD